jgi:hypothetical protein
MKKQNKFVEVIKSTNYKDCFWQSKMLFYYSYHYLSKKLYYIVVFVYVDVKFFVFSFGTLPQPFQLILLEVLICPPWITNTASEKEAMRAIFHN